MAVLQQSGVSFSGQGLVPEDKKKVESLQIKPDVPAEDIEDMIECFNEATASAEEESKNVEEKSKD
jgi:DNA-binding protein YbaB